MKKLILTAILAVAVTGLSFAQTKNGNGSQGTTRNNAGYVDANKNNVCDNYENRNGNVNKNRSQMQRRGNGTCRNNTFYRRGNGCRRG